MTPSWNPLHKHKPLLKRWTKSNTLRHFDYKSNKGKIFNTLKQLPKPTIRQSDTYYWLGWYWMHRSGCRLALRKTKHSYYSFPTGTLIFTSGKLRGRSRVGFYFRWNLWHPRDLVRLEGYTEALHTCCLDTDQPFPRFKMESYHAIWSQAKEKCCCTHISSTGLCTLCILGLLVIKLCMLCTSQTHMTYDV